MDNGTRIPGWLTGLIAVFTLAAIVTFALFLYRHAEEAALWEHYSMLKVERADLRQLSANLDKEFPPADSRIVARRTKIDELKKMAEEQQSDVEKLVVENNQRMEAIREAMKKEDATWKQKNADAKARRLDLAQEEERALKNERDFDDRRLKARNDIETLSRQLEKTKREARDDNTRQDQRIEELEARVRQLSQQRESNNRELVSDGQLIAARADDGYVVLDRGHQQNMRKGTRFVVYNRRGGRNIVKGAIEVVDVEARIATARVVEEKDLNDPLIPGDHIHNPVYNPDATKVYVIRGDFSRFSKDELARFVTESGGKVEREMSTTTDYLVAGENDPKALDQATKLGISVLSEDQLIDFVRK
jgi:NAD-dependent DNA ligase